MQDIENIDAIEDEKLYLELKNEGFSVYFTIEKTKKEDSTESGAWRVIISSELGRLTCTIYRSEDVAFINSEDYSNELDRLEPPEIIINMYNALFWFVQKVFPEVKFIDINRYNDKIDFYVPPHMYKLAFNQKTWYEDIFNAERMRHDEYRKRIDFTFNDPEYKKKTDDDIEELLKSISHFNSNDSVQLIDILQKSNTYKAFFEEVYKLHINEDKRQELFDRFMFIKPWLNQIVAYIIGGDIVSPYIWKIPVSENCEKSNVKYEIVKLSEEQPVQYVKETEDDDMFKIRSLIFPAFGFDDSDYSDDSDDSNDE